MKPSQNVWTMIHDINQTVLQKVRKSQPTNIPQTAERTNCKLLTLDFLRLTLPQRPLLQRSIEVCLFWFQLRIIGPGWKEGAQKWKETWLTTRTILRDSCRKQIIQKIQQHSSATRKTVCNCWHAIFKIAQFQWSTKM